MEDGWREGGAGSSVAERLLLTERDGPAPTIRVLGVPNEYIPQGVPDQILADCGLDPAGIANTAREALSTKS